MHARFVRAILADAAGGFAARAVTRDTGKDKAKALASAGAEVVKGDLDDVESLKKAFAGAHGVCRRAGTRLLRVKPAGCRAG